MNDVRVFDNTEHVCVSSAEEQLHCMYPPQTSPANTYKSFMFDLMGFTCICFRSCFCLCVLETIRINSYIYINTLHAKYTACNMYRYAI